MATYTTGDWSNDHPGQDPDDHEEEAMPHYRIENTTSGDDLGVYSGATEQEAIDAMLLDAGHVNGPGDVEETDDLVLTEVPPPCADRDLEARERQAEMEEREP